MKRDGTEGRSDRVGGPTVSLSLSQERERAVVQHSTAISKPVKHWIRWP